MDIELLVWKPGCWLIHGFLTVYWVSIPNSYVVQVYCLSVGTMKTLSCFISSVQLLSRVQLFATLWTVAYQAPSSTGFSRQEYWSGLPLPSPIVLIGNY